MCCDRGGCFSAMSQTQYDTIHRGRDVLLYGFVAFVKLRIRSILFFSFKKFFKKILHTKKKFAIMSSISNGKRVFSSWITTADIQLRPYGQPGRMPKTVVIQLATSVALLIELEAQFYKLVTINQCRKAYHL